MEIGDRVAAGEIVNLRRVAQGPSGMDASLVEKYISAVILHDIDFAALWPGLGVNVGSHHPEGRPHANAGRQFGAPFDATVECREFAWVFIRAEDIVTGVVFSCCAWIWSKPPAT